MEDIFGNKLFSIIDFGDDFEGIVLDNSQFAEEGFIKVFVPSIFLYKTPNKVVESKEEFKYNLIENYNDLKISNDVYSANYIKCYPSISNSDRKKFQKLKDETITEEEKNNILEELLEAYQPEIGETVEISFYNDNPLLPFFSNSHLYNKEKFKFDINEILDKNEDTVNKEEIKDEEGNIIDYYYISSNGYRRILRYKDPFMYGDDIVKLNNNLEKLGYIIEDEEGYKEHSVFNKTTESSVIDFQTKNGLKPDGIVGPITYDRISFVVEKNEKFIN